MIPVFQAATMIRAKRSPLSSSVLGLPPLFRPAKHSAL
jgi:hypothetical protein